MAIDLLFLLLLLFAIVKGYRKGFVVAVCSFLAFIVGLAAALKLSVVVANRLSGTVHVGARWLPVIAFALVMFGVALIIRIIALFIEKSLQLVMLGMVNRLFGILLYAALYSMLFSVVLFYAAELNLLTPKAIQASRFYPIIAPWGPKVVNALGAVLPWFKGMFTGLEQFFQGIAQKQAVYN